jgi:hypothetical protein
VPNASEMLTEVTWLVVLGTSVRVHEGLRRHRVRLGLYIRHAGKNLDPLAANLREKLEGGAR